MEKRKPMAASGPSSESAGDPARSSEPRASRPFRWLTLIAILGTAPLPFIGAETRFWLGMPLWFWWSAGFTVMLSSVTAWGLVVLWRGEEESGPGDE